MATLVLTDAQFEWDSNDWSDHVRSVTVEYSAELQDDTVMGDDTRSMIGGLKDWSVTAEVLADEAANEPNAVLFADVGTTATILVRPTSSAVSTTNPNYTGTAILESYQPVQGTVGDMQTFTAVFRAAGTLSRATS